jgi:hypothetical protein
LVFAAMMWRGSMGAEMATDMAPSTFVFILGTGRCGSSLVHEVMAQHRDVGFLSNVEDRTAAPAAAGRWNGPVYRHLPPSVTQKGRARFAPSEGYRILERKVSRAISTPARDLTAADATPWLAERFRRFFETRARAQRSPVFLHKFTGWPRAGFIDAVFPEARFVHVVRDGRAVANSLLQMPWWEGYRGPEGWGWGRLPEPYEREWEASGRSFPVLAALEWKVLMDAFAEARSAIPSERWLEIRYEDLIHDPTASTKELVEFAGLSWTADYEDRFLRYRFEAGRADAFRRDLGDSHLRSIDQVLRVRLAQLGYIDDFPSTDERLER